MLLDSIVCDIPFRTPPVLLIVALANIIFESYLNLDPVLSRFLGVVY
jgi:hypothetical protein